MAIIIGFINVTASIGVAVTENEEIDFEVLYKRADYALYQAKKQGRNRYVTARKGIS